MGGWERGQNLRGRAGGKKQIAEIETENLRRSADKKSGTKSRKVTKLRGSFETTKSGTFAAGTWEGEGKRNGKSHATWWWQEATRG